MHTAAAAGFVASRARSAFHLSADFVLNDATTN